MTLNTSASWGPDQFGNLMIDGELYHRRETQHEEMPVAARSEVLSEIRQLTEELDTVRSEVDRLVRCVLRLNGVEGVSPEMWLARGAGCLRESLIASADGSALVGVIDRPMPLQQRSGAVSHSVSDDAALRSRDEPTIFAVSAANHSACVALESQLPAIDRWLSTLVDRAGGISEAPLAGGHPVLVRATGGAGDGRSPFTGACALGVDLGLERVDVVAGAVSFRRPHDRVTRLLAVTIWQQAGFFEDHDKAGRDPRASLRRALCPEAHVRLWHQTVLCNAWYAFSQRYASFRERFDRSHRVLLERLTPAQRRIAQHMLHGMTEREIANRISRSQHTVHEHVKAIYRGWNVRSRSEFMAAWLSATQMFDDVVGSIGGVGGTADDLLDERDSTTPEHQPGRSGVDDSPLAERDDAEAPAPEVVTEYRFARRSATQSPTRPDRQD